MNIRLLVVGFAAAAIACSAAGGAAARSSTQQDVAFAAAQVAKYSAVPTFVAPGPAFDASQAKGKSIFIVPASSGPVGDLASMSAFTGGIRQAARAAGVKTSTCSNNGTLAAQTSCLTTAVTKKPGLVILVGSSDLVGLRDSLAALKHAGVPVLATHVLAPADFTSGVGPVYQQALSGLTATVSAPFAQAARLMADYVIATANGASTTIVLSGASDLPESAPMLATVQSEFSAQCGTSCSVSTIDVPFATWQTAAYLAVKKATLAKSTAYLLPMFDQFDDLAAEGEADARASLATVTRPSICSFGGAPFAIQMGQAANRVVCDVGENMNWDGWATMDQALRVLTGTPPVASENLPLRLWSAGNWFTEGVGLNGMTFPPQIDAGWGDPDQYINGYRALWGLPALASSV